MITGRGRYETVAGEVITIDGKDGDKWLGWIGGFRSRWGDDGTCCYNLESFDVVKKIEKEY